MTAVAVRPSWNQPAQPIFVVAGNYQEFCFWCDQHGYRHKGSEARYVMFTQTLRGCHGGRYVLTGTYQSRREWPEIERALWANAMVRWEVQPLKPPKWEPLRWDWVEITGETADFKRKVDEARQAVAEFAEAANAKEPPKPEPVELGPEWEALRERWKGGAGTS